MPRTGGEMQCRSYLPLCYSTRDLNVGADGSTWPLNNSDRTWNSGHSYNVAFPPCTMNEYLWYDKEVFKQTMLKHEATFKDQVHELHRLYRRQRELTDDIKRRELSEHQLELQTSQSKPFLSQILSEIAPKTCHTPSLPWLNPACSKPSALSTENFQEPSSFVAGKSLQAVPNSSLTKSSLEDCKLLSSESKKSGKRMLDLELPADEYIDSEEGEWFEDEKVAEVPGVPCYPLLQSDSKRVLCSGDFNSACQGNSSRTESFFSKSNDVVDLNEPIQLEEAETPNSANNLGCDTCHIEIPYGDQEPPGQPDSGTRVLTKEVVYNLQGEEDLKFSETVLLEDRQHVLLCYTDETGRSGRNLNPLLQGSFPGKSPASYVEVRAQRPTFNLLDNSNQEMCESTELDSKISERNLDLCYDKYPRMVNSCIPTSHHLFPQPCVAKSEPSLVSSRRRPISNLRTIPIAVQALPCFNPPTSFSKSSKLSFGNLGLNGKKFILKGDSTCSPIFGSLSSFQDGLFPGSQSESMTLKTSPLSTSLNPLNFVNATGSTFEYHDLTKCFKGPHCMGVNSAEDVDLNFIPSSCLLDTKVFLTNVRITHGEKKVEDSLARLHWLSESPAYNGKSNKERDDVIQMQSGFSQASPTFVCEVEPKRLGTSACPSYKKIIWSSNFKRPRISGDQFSSLTSSSSHPSPSEDKDTENSEKVVVLDSGLAHDLTLYPGKCSKDYLVVENGVDNKLSRFGNHIDLNSCITEDKSSPTSCFRSIVMKTAAETDLEAPVSPENKECFPPRGESEEHQLETLVQLSKWGDPCGELATIAAETLVNISSSGVQLYLKNTTHEPSEISSDCLHWFAGIVSSEAGDLEIEVETVPSGAADGDHSDFLPDGIDYFEAMTLNLTETKVEEYCCNGVGQKENEIGVTLLPRRGRTRLARQRKDFQAEVLPCLASLSRHEATEDLQTIGWLMEAAGTPPEIGLGRRNSGRNGCARGKRRTVISNSNEVKSTMCSLLKQQTSHSELGFVQGCLPGWGKINRRQRGQRFPASKPYPFFSRVH